MQAILLAGGLGSRLRPYTITIPKPLLPLGNKPIVDIILHQLKQAGVTEVTVCLGYLSALFQSFLGDGERYGLKITYTLEEKPLGTAGALLNVDSLNDTFFVLNGDTLTDLSFVKLLDTHKKLDADATIFSAKIDDYVDYGIVEFHKETFELQQYYEKPTRVYHVSTGVYVLSKRILEYASPDEDGRLDMPNLLHQCRDGGGKVVCHTQDDAYWRDIGRFDHFEDASKDFQATPERFLG